MIEYCIHIYSVNNHYYYYYQKLKYILKVINNYYYIIAIAQLEICLSTAYI